jgi:hypothetical protein
MKVYYSYIVLEFKGEIGYLLYKKKYLKRFKEPCFDEESENLHHDIVGIIYDNIQDKIDDELTISQLNPITEYKIEPVNSSLSSNRFSVGYFGIFNFDLFLIETDIEIPDFSKLERMVDEPSIEEIIVKIMDYKGDPVETGMDLYLN